MKLLVTSPTIIDPRSELNGHQKDIVIDNGILKLFDAGSVDVSAFKESEILVGAGLFVSPGWFDMRVNYYDPGYEHREGLLNGCEVSAYGGFTGVALLPETNPGITGKSQVEYIINKTANSIVDVYPMASLLQEGGENISEMHDLLNAGAIAFSSGYKSIVDEGLLMRAMEYSSILDVPIIITPINKSLYGKGVMHEGKVNVRLGMKGIPAVSEKIEIFKLVNLCRYSGARLHIAGISSCEALMVIEEARREGLQITTEVFGHHLTFNDEDLLSFNTNLKLRPPLRDWHDMEALYNCLNEGIIDCISSDHNPLEEDRKHCEFELAAFGASGTQTLFSQALQVYTQNNLSSLINAIAIKPREILKIALADITDGQMANLTIFDTGQEWILNDTTNKSRSKNNPYWNKTLKGKAIAVINNNKLKLLN
jgi:dihydroorotase